MIIIILYHVISYYITSFHIVRYKNKIYNIISYFKYHIISHIKSHHITSYHIISCLLLSQTTWELLHHIICVLIMFNDSFCSNYLVDRVSYHLSNFVNQLGQTPCLSSILVVYCNRDSSSTMSMENYSTKVLLSTLPLKVDTTSRKSRQTYG